MNTEGRSPQSHDINEIGQRFPDLALSSGMDEVALKELEAKYAIRLQIADQALREREIRLKEVASKIDKWANPLTVGVLVAALGLVGNFINGLWSNSNQQAQLENQKKTEKIKLQNELIKEAIKPTSVEERAKSLVFFAKNNLIELDDKVVASLTEIAGSDQPVPGSSSASISNSFSDSLPIDYSSEIVTKILNHPGVSLPSNASNLKSSPNHSIKAIILHDAYAPDSSEKILRDGRPGLPGPLAHWMVKSDGKIEFIAAETQKVSHLGKASKDLTNSNTIGIEASGIPAFADERQIENLVRLVANIADRWAIPTDMIFSHAEVAVPFGRKSDMSQQAPAIRQMVEAVRNKRDQSN